jgi:hypothetical protein
MDALISIDPVDVHYADMDTQDKLAKDAGSVVCSAHVLAD